MSAFRVMIDTNVVDALSSDPDTLSMVKRLQASGAIQLLITHLQEDELAKAPPRVFETAKTLDLIMVQAGGLVWDVSKWDRSDWPDATSEQQLGRVQGDKGKGHWADTLMSVTALGAADVFVTNDKDARNAARRIVAKDVLKLQVWDYADFVGHVETLYASW
jgi:hypothetical protein